MPKFRIELQVNGVKPLYWCRARGVWARLPELATQFETRSIAARVAATLPRINRDEIVIVELAEASQS